MAKTTTIQAILALVLLVGWAYTSMGKNGRNVKSRKNIGGSDTPGSKNSSKNKQQRHSGSRERGRNHSDRKFAKK